MTDGVGASFDWEFDYSALYPQTSMWRSALDFLGFSESLLMLVL